MPPPTEISNKRLVDGGDEADDDAEEADDDDDDDDDADDDAEDTAPPFVVAIDADEIGEVEGEAE